MLFGVMLSRYPRFWFLWSWIYLWEAASVGSWQDSTDQIGQDHLCQQAGQTYKKRFKLHLAGESGGIWSNKEEPVSADVLGTNRQTPVKHPKGIKARSSIKLTQLTAQLKCLYTNISSIVNKQ